MTSLLCVQEPGGYVQHHNKSYTSDVIRDSANHSIFTKYFPADKVRPTFLSKRPFSTPNPKIESDNLDRQSLMGHSMKLQSWLNNKSVKLVQERSDLEAKPVKDMYGSVLEREDTFVKDMMDICDHHDYLNTRKKEMLHKNWNERVYEPIRKAVIDQMDGENYNNYKVRKDQLYREYIEHLNRKGHVFRDDYDPSEYYAMGLHADRPYVVEGLQATTEKLRDPTLLQEMNRDKEDQTILQCTSGHIYRGKSLDTVRLPTLPLAPKGRHGTENDTWLAMHLTDVDSDIRQASRKRMVGSNLRSSINFGNWSVQKYGKDTVDVEMGIQKRRHCQQPPFTAPKIIGGARKRLPAAKESHRSKTLPFTNKQYLEYDVSLPPYGVDPPSMFSGVDNLQPNRSVEFSEPLEQPNLSLEPRTIAEPIDRQTLSRLKDTSVVV